MAKNNAPTTDPVFAGHANGMSRRTFARLLGVPLLVGGASLLSGCFSSSDDDDVDSGSGGTDTPAAGQSRAAFVAGIANYFEWVHSGDYQDQYKAEQPTYTDVTLGQTEYARQIEMALEAQIIDGAGGAFEPARQVTREEAAAILATAFGIRGQTEVLSRFSDAEQIAPAYAAGVSALVAAGLMQADQDDRFAPQAPLQATEAGAILTAMRERIVAPPQVMCKSGTTAPRRFIRISTPTPGASIYYTSTQDGSEPADPLTKGQLYDFYAQGVLQFAQRGQTRVKAVAVKDGMLTSAVQEYFWNLGVPDTAEYEAVVFKAGDALTPKVWKVFNRAENLGPYVYYLEGSTRGLVFDCGQIAPDKANLKTFIDSIASKPYDMVVGHNHPDHSSQIYNFTAAGIPFYCSAIEKAAFMADRNADRASAGRAAQALAHGHTFNLGGGHEVSIFIMPGHTNGCVTALVHRAGLVFGSDMWGCNRPATADTTQYSSVKVDLFLSLTLQILADYRKRIPDGEIREVVNAHQEVGVGMACVNNFLTCFQKLIDEGDAASEPSIRGGVSNRMSMVGDMWRDKNWMAIGPIGSGYTKPVDYLSLPTSAYPNQIALDYNVDNGYRKYSVLGNIEFADAALQGVKVYWAAPANGEPNCLPDRFDPWTLNYTVLVPRGQRSVTLRPQALSSRVAAMTVNGQAVGQGEAVTVPVSAGSRIIVAVTAPDGSNASRYTFTINEAA